MLQFPYFEWKTILLGPLTIQVWGLFVAFGIGVSFYIIYKRAKKYGFDSDLLLDIALWVVIFGFLGARAGTVLLYDLEFYLSNPWQIIAVWNGGFSSFGGFIGAICGFLFIAKRKKLSKAKILQIADQLAFASLPGWMIARVGCVMIHDHWGIPCNCPFAIKTTEGPRLDMALLEILALIPLIIFFFLWRNMKKPIGFFLGVLLVYYSVIRFFLDFLRATDIVGADTRYLGLTPAQYFAIVFAAWGVYVLQKAWKR